MDVKRSLACSNPISIDRSPTPRPSPCFAHEQSSDRNSNHQAQRACRERRQKQSCKGDWTIRRRGCRADLDSIGKARVLSFSAQATAENGDNLRVGPVLFECLGNLAPLPALVHEVHRVGMAAVDHPRVRHVMSRNDYICHILRDWQGIGYFVCHQHGHPLTICRSHFSTPSRIILTGLTSSHLFLRSVATSRAWLRNTA